MRSQTFGKWLPFLIAQGASVMAWSADEDTDPGIKRARKSGRAAEADPSKPTGAQSFGTYPSQPQILSHRSYPLPHSSPSPQSSRPQIFHSWDQEEQADPDEESEEELLARLSVPTPPIALDSARNTTPPPSKRGPWLRYWAWAAVLVLIPILLIEVVSEWIRPDPTVGHATPGVPEVGLESLPVLEEPLPEGAGQQGAGQLTVMPLEAELPQAIPDGGMELADAGGVAEQRKAPVKRKRRRHVDPLGEAPNEPSPGITGGR